jgi:hypothetical protein
VRKWVRILRWTALDDVADVDVLSSQPDPGQQLIEELPCRTYEGPPLLVLMETRRLPHTNNLRVRASFPGHRPCALVRQLALNARGNLAVQVPQFRAVVRQGGLLRLFGWFKAKKRAKRSPGPVLFEKPRE